MTTEQKQNLALAAEAVIIIYLLFKKKEECKSKSSGGGGGTTAPPPPPARLTIPQIASTTTTSSATTTTTPTTTTTTPSTTVVTPETEPTTDKGFRTGGIKPSTRKQNPVQQEVVGEPCPNMEGWFLCPSTGKCYPPIAEADIYYDYCGNGDTPTMKKFVNYVKEANFFRKTSSNFR